MSDPIERIDALIKNARATWFALLGALIFVAITLMGVEHIDFYGVNRATKLPLVDVSVPTRLFFAAAPILTASIFGYFHLYLLRVWDALGAAPARVNGVKLGDAIAPWLVTDAALHMRRRLRQDNCTTPRSLEYPAMLLNFGLAWGLGIGILFALWITSMTARSPDMTLFSGGLSLLAAGCVATASALVMRRRMRDLTNTDKRPIWAWATLALSSIAAVVFVFTVSIERTSTMLGWYQHGASAEQAIIKWLHRNDPQPPEDGSSGGGYALPTDFWSYSFLTLAPINLAGQQLVQRPDTWLPQDIARKEFRAKWCARENVKDCKTLTTAETTDFIDEWTTRRRAQIDALQKPGVNPVNPTLYADYSTELQEYTRRNGLDLRNADLRGSFINGINLVAARMQNANLRGAQMEGANLTGAQMEGADLFGAQMEGADLTGAQMEGANLKYSLLTGTVSIPTLFFNTNLSASINDGGALRFVDLTPAIFDNRSDWRNAFLDASVTTPDFLRLRSGAPCQWLWARQANDGKPLPDEMFFGMWRGWVEPNLGRFYDWEYFAPKKWSDVPVIPPPESCKWQTGPLPKWHRSGR